MSTLRALLLSSCLVLSGTCLGAAPVLEVISLHYRTAEEVLPQLQPHLAAEGSLSGTGQQIIIRTEAQNLEQLKKIIQQLDRRPHQYRIELQFVQDQLLEQSGTELRLQHEGDATAARFRHYQTHDEDRDQGVYSVTALEGRPAWIQSGRLVPFENTVLFFTAQGLSAQTATDFLDISKGFYAQVWPAGPDQVRVEIASHARSQETVKSLTTQSQELHTQVQGRLGEWLVLGSVGQRESNARVYTTRREQQGRILLRVRAAP